MKTTIASALFAAFAAMAAQSAFAADGTITFTGSVTNTTCTINGAAQGNLTVTLPTVSSTDLATLGSVSGATPFSIALTKCTGSATEVAAYFQPGATINTADGNLTNQSATGGATNVEVQLLNQTGQSAIKLGAAAASQNSTAVPITGGNATLQYIAQYFATGAATAGPVSTTVTYTLNYQ